MCDLTEFNKLKDLLINQGIPFEERYCENTGNHQLIYPCDGSRRKSDVVIGEFTYGGKHGLLEQMGLIPNKSSRDVEGWLDAETVFRRWRIHYISHLLKV